MTGVIEMAENLQDELEAVDEPKSRGLVGDTDSIDAHGDPDDENEMLESVLSVEELEGIRWRVAEALLALRRQINAAAPDRERKSDGTIGDDNHRKKGFTSSDHNPHVFDGPMGVVTAMDVTHDPRHCDGNRLAASLHASRDPRIKYIIWDRRIANSSPVGGAPAWQWRPYGGSNPHTQHVHLSVKGDKSLYDSQKNWNVALKG